MCTKGGGGEVQQRGGSTSFVGGDMPLLQIRCVLHAVKADPPLLAKKLDNTQSSYGRQRDWEQDNIQGGTCFGALDAYLGPFVATAPLPD